jgi:signal transduction histidine kinase
MLLNTYVDDNLAPGLYAYLRVMDNGPGMESQVLERAFDPFFSTKFINRGLGLAEILGVVRAHKGAVKLDSRPEFGCTATLFLPASKG